MDGLHRSLAVVAATLEVQMNALGAAFDRAGEDINTFDSIGPVLTRIRHNTAANSGHTHRHGGARAHHAWKRRRAAGRAS